MCIEILINMKYNIKVFFTLSIFCLIFNSASAQSLINLNDGSYTEGAGPTIIDSDVSVSGDDDFTGGYVEFTISNSDINDNLSIISGGSLSVSGNAVFLDSLRIGTIDDAKNGLNGNPLRINFNTFAPLANSGFETGDLSFWNVDTTFNQMNGQSWAEGPDAFGYTADSNPKVDDWAYNEIYTSASIAMVSADSFHSGLFGLRMDVSGKLQSYNDLGSPYGYGTIHTPSIISNPFSAAIGDELSLWYNAAKTEARTDDYTDIFGFIFSDDNGNSVWDSGEPLQELFHHIDSTTGGWVNLNTTLMLEGFNLQFWFVNGSYDSSGGGKVGSYLYIDDIILTFLNPQVTTNMMVESIIEHAAFYNSCGDDSHRNLQVTINDGNASASGFSTIFFTSTLPELEAVTDIEKSVNPGTCTTTLETYPVINAVDICEVTYSLIAGLGAAGEFPLGVTTETWVATDTGGNKDTLSFTVTVTAAYNDAPVIDAITDVTVAEDSALIEVPLSGIGIGNDCEAQTVTFVSAVSSNASLIEGLAVVYTPGDATGSIRLNIAAGMSGTATIEVTVMDNGGTANGGINTTVEEFVVTVTATNDAPFVVNPLHDCNVDVGKVLEVDIRSSLGDVFDDEDDVSVDVSVSLENGDPLPVWGVYADEVLTVAPFLGDTGCYNILVAAKDAGGLTATDEFMLCILRASTGIEEIEKLVYLDMFPNPTRNLVNIEIKGIYDLNVEVVVLNISGKEVLRQEFLATNLIRFDMGNHLSGMYFIKLKIDGIQVVKKLILDRK